jgi:hypothetical protein
MYLLQTIVLSESSTMNSTINCKPSVDADTISSVCTLLHHQDETHYILTKFCLPVPNVIDPNNPPLCKYGKKSCMIKRSKVYQNGTPVFDLSPTVFIPLAGNLRIYKYNIIDTRTYKCCQPSCFNSKGKVLKLFHHACYMHGMSQRSNDQDIKMVVMECMDDKILDYLQVNTTERKVLNHLFNQETPILFPVCGKRCYKSVVGYRTKEIIVLEDVLEEIPEPPSNWDKDGKDGKPSSIKVLIDWLTTEENASMYFGGVNEVGKTNAMRKESYHKVIRQIIIEKNGKLLNCN